MVDNLRYERFEIAVDLEVEPAMLKWSGTIDTRTPESVLAPFFKELVGVLSDKSCIIDFTALEYMNSSTVGPCFRFVKQLDAAGVRTEIRYSRAIHWQRTSLRALAVIAQRLQNTKVVAL